MAFTEQTPRSAAESADFGNLLAVLRREAPARPTLFEFFLNDRLYEQLAPGPGDPGDPYRQQRITVRAFLNGGYDYGQVKVPGFGFASQREQHGRTISLNAGAVITGRESFVAYEWPDPEAAAYDVLDSLAGTLPSGVRLIVWSDGGVLENAIALVGYERLCYMLYDDARLVESIFDEIGARLLRYYEIAAVHQAVGACIANDDWGFKTQTMLAPDDLRRLVFPWYRRIVAASHAAGKPAILHSCGRFDEIIDDIVDDMEFDARHSFEDTILPVEEAYERYHDRIAILGGIDVDFVCRAAPDEVYERSRAMLERAAGRGGYALGTGNSVPDYVPDDNYFAMVRAALEGRV